MFFVDFSILFKFIVHQLGKISCQIIGFCEIDESIFVHPYTKRKLLKKLEATKEAVETWPEEHINCICYTHTICYT